jgi:hypothetical protein
MVFPSVPPAVQLFVNEWKRLFLSRSQAPPHSTRSVEEGIPTQSVNAIKLSAKMCKASPARGEARKFIQRFHGVQSSALSLT